MRRSRAAQREDAGSEHAPQLLCREWFAENNYDYGPYIALKKYDVDSLGIEEAVVEHNALKDAYTALSASAPDMAAEIERLRSINADLTRQLTFYGVHTDTCPAHYDAHVTTLCNCGFRAAVKIAREESKP